MTTGHGPMSDLSPLSGEERKSNFGAVRSVDETQNGHRIETPVQYFGVFPRPIPR